MAKRAGNRGLGRKKGSVNKITRTVREAFTEAFAAVNQGPSALAAWGKANPDKFYPLATKLIPTEVTGSIAVASGVLAVPMPVTAEAWAGIAAAQQARPTE